MEKLNISVLFVDDDKIIRTVYKRIIGDLVDNVYFASDGIEGLAMFYEHRPDLIITDIKMPMMSGLDMAITIKSDHPNTRIVILSALSEGNYFIRAIQIGIKSFLLKPVDNQRLRDIIREQAHEILLEQKIKNEEQKRIKAEKELKRNELLLQAVSETAQQLLQFGFNATSISESFSILGSAAKVDRVYLFENFYRGGKYFSQQKYEWVKENISQQIDNEDLLRIPHDLPLFSRWHQKMIAGESIFGLIKDFPEPEQKPLFEQEIVSILAIPIFVKKKWYGFIGFDNCTTEHQWSASEMTILKTAASLIGSAIYRSNIENELHTLNAELENRVRERTQNLLEEISERKTAEIMLRLSEEKYRSIFENANDAIFLTINDQIRLINPRFYEMTGYYPNHMIGKSFLEIVAPKFHFVVSDLFHKSSHKDKNEQSNDIQIITAKKTMKWVEIKSKSINWEGKNGLLTFIADINARKTFESDLKELNANLESRVLIELKNREKQQELFLHKSKLESLGELSAGMAHEINQPLGGLSMSLDNILDDLNNKGIQPEYLNKKINLMFDDINRIRQLIDHVRVFSRDQQVEDQRVFDIVDVINNSLLLVNKLYINNRINLSVSIKSKNLMVYGNPFRLEQVFLNILSNARYAVDKKQQGSPNDYSKTIVIELSSTHDKHTITISDNGIGIPEA
ncbi:MAG: response regulator, partial [Bacteroidales bacterium]|nr:response regulator [Bacteroidales bacterium]